MDSVVAAVLPPGLLLVVPVRAFEVSMGCVVRARLTRAGCMGIDRKGGVVGLPSERRRRGPTAIPSSWPSCACERMATDSVSIPCSRYPSSSGPTNVWNPR